MSSVCGSYTEIKLIFVYCPCTLLNSHNIYNKLPLAFGDILCRQLSMDNNFGIKGNSPYYLCFSPANVATGKTCSASQQGHIP